MAEKPDIVFHGSRRGIEGPLTPRTQTGDAAGEFPEGPRDLVFATDDRNMALGYALKTEHMFGVLNHPEGDNIFLFTDRDGWESEIAQSECAVYHLPSGSFEQTQVNGQPVAEWKSRETVMPVGKEHVTPEKVMDTGGQMFFLPEAIDRELWSEFMDRTREKSQLDGVSGAHLMRELQERGLIEHYLNEETGVNAKEMPKHDGLSEAISQDLDWLEDQVKGEGVSKDGPSPPPAGITPDIHEKAVSAAAEATSAIERDNKAPDSPDASPEQPPQNLGMRR